MKFSYHKLLVLPLLFLTAYVIFLNKPSQTFANNPWLPASFLPYQLASHTSVAISNNIFVINGSADFMSSHNTVLSTSPNENGSINSWNVESQLTPSALIWHVSASKEPYVYILGGKEENQGSDMSHVNKVFVGKLLNGSSNYWMQTSNLPQALSRGGAITFENYLIYIGGMREQGGNIYNQLLFKSTINDNDGTIGNWTEAGLLPVPLSGFGLVLNGNHLTIVGGENNDGKTLNVYAAYVDEDGMVSGWELTNPLPKPLSRFGLVQSGQRLYVLGGINASGSTSDDVYYADIFSDGTVSEWQASNYKLPQPTCCGSAVSHNGYIYLIGGHNTNNGEYYDEVYFAKAADIAPPVLAVPYFSQNADPWGPSEYDHTLSLGVATPSATMDRWGCAVTSVAMIMKYHGMTKMPDGTDTDPESVNNWLKENNGYSYGINQSGWYSGIRWAAIGKLTKALFEDEKSDKKLQVDLYNNNTETTDLLNTDLTVDKIPDILWVKNASTSGHYVVAKGKTADSYTINDPEWNVADLTSFNNTYHQLVRYEPSETDLSFIDIAVNPEIEILVTDSETCHINALGVS